MRWLFFLLMIAGIGAIPIAIKVSTLKEIIEKKFNVSKRWNIPSRVYSDTEYLYPGIDLEKRGLKEKLERLGYRLVEESIRGPGDVVWEKDRVDIYLHDFQYPQEPFTGFPVRLEITADKISKIIDLESNDELSLIRLEPEEIATLFDEKMEDRTLIKLKDCPRHLLEAIILIEDARFFQHKGIDPIAIFRAALADIMTLKMAQGGSTLTQQLVKNFFLTSKKSLGRKLDEALMAVIIETRYSKGEIFEAYLNEIYLGQRGPSSVTGVAEASKHYFGKDIHQITEAEAALLAGMIRYPSRYSPLRSKERAMERRNFVLKRMREAKVIDEATFQRALQEEIITPTAKIQPVLAPYFIDFLKNQLVELYPQEILETEGLKIFTTLDMSMQIEAQRALSYGLANLETAYAYKLPKDHKEGLQGCLVVLSPQNGYVRAMVGGREYVASQFNRCTQAKRQPGSTFKPFVYLTALDPLRTHKIFTPATLIEDTKFTMQTALGPWTPSNYDQKEHGLVTLRRALERSYNIATARLAVEVGLEEIIQTARNAGIRSALNPVPSLALGAFEVSPIEMAIAYTLFPNRGLRAEALSVIHVMKPNGTVLEKKTLKIKRTFNEAPVALVTDLMRGVMERGTGASAKSLGFKGVAAGKTGTTSNYRDAWFVGFTSQLLGLVWVGYDDNTTHKLSGASASLPIWVDFMKQVVEDHDKQDFPFPGEIVEVNIDPETGGLATKSCEKSSREYFISGTEPSEFCPHLTGKPLSSLSMEETDPFPGPGVYSDYEALPDTAEPLPYGVERENQPTVEAIPPVLENFPEEF